jgi:two-component system, sensor histidine kinase PdtaS
LWNSFYYGESFKPLNNLINDCPGLTEEDQKLLEKIEQQIKIVADVSRADIFLYGRLSPRDAVVVSHAKPHSVAPVYAESRLGLRVGTEAEPLVLEVFQTGRNVSGQKILEAERAPIFKQVNPIFSADRPGKVIAACSIESNLIERERQRRRSSTFQSALHRLQSMAQAGWLEGTDTLTPFYENEGVLVVNREGKVIYASGVAANLYRRLGYLADLVRRPLESIETHDLELFKRVQECNCAIEMESDEGHRIWIRKGLPLLVKPGLLSQLANSLKKDSKPYGFNGALILVRDETEKRKKEQELNVKSAMILEVHHRVKNNLQTIAALLRIQTRRVQSEEAKNSLEEAINRILSVAVIHEFLSAKNTGVINVQEMCQRILGQLQQGIIDPDKTIQFKIESEPIFLPSRQATACALIINELMQNAVEHAFETRETGKILLKIEDTGKFIQLMIKDDGMGLPPEFSIDYSTNLGLQIVRTLVQEDLKGTIDMQNDSGVLVTIRFPKASFGGEEDWNAPE